METKEVRKYIGEKTLLILKNNFVYTVVIPEFDGNTLSFIDRHGDDVTLNTEFIKFMKKAKEKKNDS